MNRFRTLAPKIVFALCAILAAALVGRYLIASGSPAPATQPARLIPNTDVNPYGANFFLHEEVEEWKREKTVRLAQAAGIGWAKQEFLWSDIEPSAKGDYTLPGSHEDSWKKYDQIVALYERYGMQVIARLDRAPDWARPADSRKEHPPADLSDFGDFVYTFVDHYRGRIHYIQIWNEPNIYPEWGEQAVDPTAYTEMLKIAATRARQADPNIRVLSAPLAITTETAPERRNLSDLVFLEEMYQAGAAAYFDILSANAFGMDQAPSAPALPSTLNFARVTLQREIMEEHGDGNKAIWFNEYGWNAAPESFPEEQLTWKRVSEELQASYTVEGIDLARQQWPWAGVFNIWYFRQVGYIQPTDPAYYFRMVDVDFTPRPLYYAVQQATSALRVASAGAIEETHPAITWNYGWEPVWDNRASGGSCVRASTAGASMTVLFLGDGIELVTSQSTEQGQLMVRLDGNPVAGLPTNSTGETTLNLSADESGWQAHLPIDNRLDRREHTLELSVPEAGDSQADVSGCLVDGFVISDFGQTVFPTASVVLTMFGMVGSLAYFLWDRRRRPPQRRQPPRVTVAR